MAVSTSPHVARRVFDALTLPGVVRFGQVAEPVRRLSTGVALLDATLDGGWPRGRLSELSGPITSGKTAVLLAGLAAAIQRGEATALIDCADAFHPAAAQSAGIELGRLLWVRPPSVLVGVRCTEMVLDAGGFGCVALDLGAVTPQRVRLMTWPRLARAAERAGAAVVIVAPHRVAGSFAAMSLTLTPRRALWSHGAWPLFDGIALRLSVARNKLGASRATSVELKAESHTTRVSSF